MKADLINNDFLKKNYFMVILVIGLVISISTISVIFFLSKQDIDPPIVKIENPKHSETVSGEIEISFSAKDQETNIEHKEIIIDGVSVSNNSYFYSWNTTKEGDGSHTIKCKATDSFGNTGYDEISIIVENLADKDFTDPLINITSPADGTVVSGIVLINMTATDESGISFCAIFINSTLKTKTPSYKWNTTKEKDGYYNILCKANDTLGNTGFSQITVRVNNSHLDSQNTETFKLMTFNIKESGEDPSYPDWKSVVKEENADIVLLIETGYWDDNDNEKFKQYLNEFNLFFNEEQPYEGYITQGISYSTSGCAVMSRFSILTAKQITEVTLDNGSNYDVTHDFLHVEVNVTGKLINLIGSHLKAMSGDINEQRRELEQEGIINYMDNLGNVPVTYLGDLNSFSPEDWGLNTLQKGLGYGPLSMMNPPFTDPLTGNNYSSFRSLIHNWTDVHRALNPSKLGITSPIYDSRIDFIYTNHLLTPYIINSTSGDTSHATTGSDHYTVDVIFDLNGVENDFIAPSIVITNPKDQAVINETIKIDITSKDFNTVSSQRILIDGIGVSNNSSFIWDTTIYSDGIHKIRAEAEDPSGNSRFDIVEVTVDNKNHLNIIINEFLPDPHILYSEEWIELYNPLNVSVDLSGFIIDDVLGADGSSSPYTLPEGTIISSKGFIIINQTDTDIYLNNDGDEVNLIDQDGTTIIDYYSYSYSSNDVSWGRKIDGGLTWETFTEPTPNSSNGGSS